MVRILCIISSLDVGGAETFMMKIFRSLDLHKYRMDFMVSTDRDCAYNSEVKRLGGRIINITGKEENFIKNFLEIERNIKKYNYNYIIKVSEYSVGVFDLLAARIGGARHLSIRSTNGGSSESKGKLLLHKLFVPFVQLLSTSMIAPSKEAALFTFGKNSVINKKVVYLHNGVNLKEYCTPAEEINRIKKELDIEGKFVLGHIGRFSKQKNHLFLINIFREYHKKNPDSVLLLIGMGELKAEIEEKVNKYNLNRSVKFLGLRGDVPKVLSVIDVVLLPSFYEGMPNVIIEAQAAGVPCVVSDTITKECNLTGEVRFAPLNKNINEWIYCIETSKRIDYDDAHRMIIKKQYDINSVSKLFLQTVCT